MTGDRLFAPWRELHAILNFAFCNLLCDLCVLCGSIIRLAAAQILLAFVPPLMISLISDRGRRHIFGVPFFLCRRAARASRTGNLVNKKSRTAAPIALRADHRRGLEKPPFRRKNSSKSSDMNTFVENVTFPQNVAGFRGIMHFSRVRQPQSRHSSKKPSPTRDTFADPLLPSSIPHKKISAFPQTWQNCQQCRFDK
jgi:hypothetical protein